MWCIVYRTCDICDGLVICIDAILVFVNYIFIVITACNVPAFIYIVVVFILKNREKEKKCVNFAECLCKNTRQSGLHMSAEHPLCRVLKSWHSAKIWTFAECQDPALGKATTWRDPGRPFCWVPTVRHSAKMPSRVAPRCSYAECQGSRQSLCRVPEIRHSAKTPLPWEALPSGVCRVQTGLCRV